MNVITLDDDGGGEPNRYKIVFTGETEPEPREDRGASINDAERTYKNDDGQWVALGLLEGGRDSWAYTGARDRTVIQHPDRVSFGVNNREFRPADAFDVTGDPDWPAREHDDPEDGGPSSGSGGDETGDGANRSSGSDTGGVGYVVSPGDLQGALEDLAEDAGDAPREERRSFARLQPNATFDPGETVHIPRNMVLDCSGASIVPSASYDLFTLDLGSLIVRPYVNLRGLTGTYDARVFTVDPANITYGADPADRNAGYVDQDAWKPRGEGPDNMYRFVEHERQNFFGNGTGVRGGHTLGKPRDNSTVFYLHQDTENGSWQVSCLALFSLSHSAREAAYPVDLHSEGSDGFVNDVEVRGFYTGFRVGVAVRGEATARKNRFLMDLQPQDGLTKHAVYLDNPTAQRNYYRGCTWDPQKSSGPMIDVRRATGENVFESLTGHDRRIMRDPTGENHVINPFGGY